MTNRQRISAILHYENYDRMPIVHFGFWRETLLKWAEEGHITKDQALYQGDGNDIDKELTAKMGFDCNYQHMHNINVNINPEIPREIIEEMPDGSRKVVDPQGVIILEKPGIVSIPMEIDHLLKSRKEWDEIFKPRMAFTPERAAISPERKQFIEDPNRESFFGLYVGSLYGMIRNWIGVEGSAYIYMDDEELFIEMIDTVGNLSYECTKYALEQSSGFDFLHFWEDICFKSGPLIKPSVFDEYVGHHYKRITDLGKSYGIDIVSLDCDGLIDALIPTWLNNGVNTMFPMEVGTWHASIAPWREKYGKDLRGVGGMNKVVFSHDYAAIDSEIERMKPLVDLGGYIPCVDHRIAPDAKWDNVLYYADKFRKVFG